ncbi:MAG: hypothetical protein ACYTG2_14260 [Planctomycetota bacterium]|jgi:chromosome segregation ATPase
MKWALDQIKSALREKAQRRSVKDLVQSGARSVRVISEEKIYQLIQAVVTDTLGSKADGMPDDERERIVVQAKERLNQVLKQNTTAEHRSRRQQETILTYQRQVERLERERLALLEKTREAHERETLSQQAARDAAGGVSALREELEDVRRELQAARGERDAALKLVHETAERHESEASEQALSALRSELGDLKQALSGLSDQQHAFDQSRLDDVITRLAHHEEEATKTLEERFARSMDQVLDQVGRTLREATAKPIDRPVEATEVMLSKVFESDSHMESNIGDLGVAERSSERGINRSLERLRAARKGEAEAPAAPKSPSAKPGKTTKANGTPSKKKTSRRKGAAERRRGGGSRPAATERRKGPRERRKSTAKGKTTGRDATTGRARRKS